MDIKMDIIMADNDFILVALLFMKDFETKSASYSFTKFIF